jgi:hypothetical protein
MKAAFHAAAVFTAIRVSSVLSDLQSGSSPARLRSGLSGRSIRPTSADLTVNCGGPRRFDNPLLQRQQDAFAF